MEQQSTGVKEPRIEWLAKAKKDDTLVKHTARVVEYAWMLAEKNKLDDVGRANLIKAAFFHDLGKMEYYFQKRMIEKAYKDDPEKKELLLEKLRKIFAQVPKREWEGHFHVYLSVLWAAAYGERGREIVIPVFVHHYTSDYLSLVGENIVGREGWEIYSHYIWDYILRMEFLRKYVEEIRENVVSELRKLGLDGAANILESLAFDSSFFNKIKEEEEFAAMNYQQPAAVLDLLSDLLPTGKLDLLGNAHVWEIAGLLKRADHLASAAIDESRELMEFAVSLGKEELLSRIEKRLESVGVKRDRLWQLRVVPELGDHVIVTAPTGAGKTELALLWTAERGRELLFTVPVRAALNDLYNFRFKEYFESSAGLLHSTAFMEYVRESSGEDVSVGSKVALARNLMQPYLLSTPDQVLLTSLTYFGFDKVLSKYKTSVIVVDEIQGYTPDMLAVVARSLELAVGLGTPVLVMTATLPAYVREVFGEKLGFVEKDLFGSKELEDLVKMKRHRVKFVGEVFVDREKEKDNKKRRILIKYISEELKNKIKKDKFKFIYNKLVEKNIKTLSVFNTVKAAIAFYMAIKELSGIEKPLYLFHSRLPEAKKLDILRKVKSEESKEWILVATQVVEASVDVDADFMVTELAPIDSLVQRWGRVYRRREYNGDEPNIIVVQGDKYAESIYTMGSKAMEHVMEETENLFKPNDNDKDTKKSEDYRNKILTPEDERKMIEEVYEKAKELFKKEFYEVYEGLEYFTAAKRSDAQRIFRHLAGVQVVFPALLKHEDIGEKIWRVTISGKEFDKEALHVLAEKIEEGSSDSWGSLSEELGLDKWELRALVHGASVNVPFYYLERRGGLVSHDWKGYLVSLWSGSSERSIGDLWEYGLDYILGDWEEGADVM